MSKFSLNVLKKRVFPFAFTNDPAVIQAAAFGEDVALSRIEEGILVSHVDPIIGAIDTIGWLGVHVACNDIATSGAPPRWILVLVLVPGEEDEDLLEKIMRQVDAAARQLNVSVIGGHTGYSSGISRPLVAVTALGTLSDREPILSSGAQIGDHILVSKGIALEGTAILAHDFARTARRLGITDEELNEAGQLLKKVSVVPEAIALGGNGATAMHDVTRGGLLEALLEIALLSGVGMEIKKDRIWIPPVVERFSDAFDFNPMKMISSGTLVATIPPSKLEKCCRLLEEISVHCTDIGRVIEGKGVNVWEKETISHCETIHCENDELARMWEIHKPDQKG